MTRVRVVVPTVAGREEYLDRCLRGYDTRTDLNVTLDFQVIRDKDSCGLAWQEGAARGGIPWDYLHLTADDIVPGENWLPPLIEACEAGVIPAGLVVIPTAEALGDDLMPKPGNPLTPVTFFYEDPGSTLEGRPDWKMSNGPSEYAAVPFCSRAQWERIGPMIASHYSTDKWFTERARRAGIPCVARHGAYFYHYAAQMGRVPKGEGWFHKDWITFDQVIAYPDYLSGAVPPEQPHPLNATDEGLRRTREWYAQNVPPGDGYYWECAR